MEPKSIEFEELEGKYFKELSHDDCVVDAAAVMATDYHYRCDYVKRKRVIFSLGIIACNLFPSSMIWTLFLDKENWTINLTIYVILLVLWLFLMEMVYRSKSKKPDRLQYFFITKTRLFVSNREGDFIIPFENIRKVKPIKHIKKLKKCVCIEIRHGYSVLDEVSLHLYVGADDAERIYNELSAVCKKGE